MLVSSLHVEHFHSHGEGKAAYDPKRRRREKGNDGSLNVHEAGTLLGVVAVPYSFQNVVGKRYYSWSADGITCLESMPFLHSVIPSTIPWGIWFCRALPSTEQGMPGSETHLFSWEFSLPTQVCILDSCAYSTIPGSYPKIIYVVYKRRVLLTVKVNGNNSNCQIICKSLV